MLAPCSNGNFSYTSAQRATYSTSAGVSITADRKMWRKREIKVASGQVDVGGPFAANRASCHLLARLEDRSGKFLRNVGELSPDISDSIRCYKSIVNCDKCE
jgi:hypothetical protein